VAKEEARRAELSATIDGLEKRLATL